jgi:hypothetical protein
MENNDILGEFYPINRPIIKTKIYSKLEVLLAIYVSLSLIGYSLLLVSSKVTLSYLLNSRLRFGLVIIFNTLPIAGVIFIYSKKRIGWFITTSIIVYNLLVRCFIILQLWFDLKIYSSASAIYILGQFFLFALLISLAYLLFCKSIIGVFAITKLQKNTTIFIAVFIFIILNFILDKLIGKV